MDNSSSCPQAPRGLGLPPDRDQVGLVLEQTGGWILASAEAQGQAEVNGRIAGRAASKRMAASAVKARPIQNAQVSEHLRAIGVDLATMPRPHRPAKSPTLIANTLAIQMLLLQAAKRLYEVAADLWSALLATGKRK